VITESVVIPLPKSRIEHYLSAYTIQVVASRLTEDGWELVLEGDLFEVSEFLYELHSEGEL
jgi:hypothetical protein